MARQFGGLPQAGEDREKTPTLANRAFVLQGLLFAHVLAAARRCNHSHARHHIILKGLLPSAPAD